MVKKGLLCLFWLNSTLNQEPSQTLGDWDVHFAVKRGRVCNVAGSAQNHSERNCLLRVELMRLRSLKCFKVLIALKS